MLLAVDIGNTNITLGIVEDGVIDAVRRAGTHRATTADELEVLLRDLLSLDEHALEGVTAIGIASVVPSVTALTEQVAGRLGIPALVASSGTAPIAIRLDRPDLVGADRIVNALAALRLYGAPAVVCDLGTATTLDCVGADGAFVGGAIAAGLELGIAALSTGTAKLPRVELRTPDRVIARDTVSAIQAGSVLGYQALVAGLIGRARAELAETAGIAPGAVHTILTGGLSAAPWARDIAGVDAIDPDLTLKGLTILHAEVAGGDPFREHRFEDVEPFPDEGLDDDAGAATLFGDADDDVDADDDAATAELPA